MLQHFKPVALLLGVLCAACVTAADFPTKPIRIVTANVGGGDDYTARTVAQALGTVVGQPVVVDNRGASFIAAEVVANSPPDGYSLTVQGAGFWINPLLRKVPYEMSQFAPISLLTREVFVLAVTPSLQVNTVQELIAAAKAKPGAINHGTGVTGTSAHLAAELLKSMAGVNMTRVAYKGAAAALTGALGGEVSVVLTDLGLVMPHIKSGKLKPLGVTSAKPSPLAPGIPAIAATVPGFETGGMSGLFAPAKTPRAIIDRLSQDVVRAVNAPEVKEKFVAVQAEVVGSTPVEYAAIIKSETAKISKLIKDANIRVD